MRSAEIVCKANGCFGHRASSVFRRGGMRAYIYCSKVSSKRRKCRFRDPSFKMGFQTYIFCSKVPSKCRKCRFRDPNFKMGFQTYIFCSKVPSKCRKCRFRDPNFKQFPGGAYPRTPLQLCRYYGLSLTKILATPLHRASKIASQLTIFNDS